MILWLVPEDIQYSFESEITNKLFDNFSLIKHKKYFHKRHKKLEHSKK